MTTNVIDIEQEAFELLAQLGENLEDTLGAFLLFLYNNCVLKMDTPGIKDRCDY